MVGCFKYEYSPNAGLEDDPPYKLSAPPERRPCSMTRGIIDALTAQDVENSDRSSEIKNGKHGARQSSEDSDDKDYVTITAGTKVTAAARALLLQDGMDDTITVTGDDGCKYTVRTIITKVHRDNADNVAVPSDSSNMENSSIQDQSTEEAKASNQTIQQSSAVATSSLSYCPPDTTAAQCTSEVAVPRTCGSSTYANIAIYSTRNSRRDSDVLDHPTPEVKSGNSEDRQYIKVNRDGSSTPTASTEYATVIGKKAVDGIGSDKKSSPYADSIREAMESQVHVTSSGGAYNNVATGGSSGKASQDPQDQSAPEIKSEQTQQSVEVPGDSAGGADKSAYEGGTLPDGESYTPPIFPRIIETQKKSWKSLFKRHHGKSLFRKHSKSDIPPKNQNLEPDSVDSAHTQMEMSVSPSSAYEEPSSSTADWDKKRLDAPDLPTSEIKSEQFQQSIKVSADAAGDIEGAYEEFTLPGGKSSASTKHQRAKKSANSFKSGKCHRQTKEKPMSLWQLLFRKYRASTTSTVCVVYSDYKNALPQKIEVVNEAAETTEEKSKLSPSRGSQAVRLREKKARAYQDLDSNSKRSAYSQMVISASPSGAYEEASPSMADLDKVDNIGGRKSARQDALTSVTKSDDSKIKQSAAAASCAREYATVMEEKTSDSRDSNKESSPYANGTREAMASQLSKTDGGVYNNIDDGGVRTRRFSSVIERSVVEVKLSQHSSSGAETYLLEKVDSVGAKGISR